MNRMAKCGDLSSKKRKDTLLPMNRKDRDSCTNSKGKTLSTRKMKTMAMTWSLALLPRRISCGMLDILIAHIIIAPLNARLTPGAYSYAILFGKQKVGEHQPKLPKVVSPSAPAKRRKLMDGVNGAEKVTRILKHRQSAIRHSPQSQAL